MKLETVGIEHLSIRAFNAKQATFVKSHVVNVVLQDNYGRNHTIQACTTEGLHGSIRKLPLSRADRDYIVTNEIELDETHKLPRSYTPRLLIGCDYVWEFLVSTKEREILPSGRQLIPTATGYIVSGKSKVSTPAPDYSMMAIIEPVIDPVTEEEDKQRWKRSIEMEQVGCENPQETKNDEIERINQAVVRQFKETIQKRDDGYHVKFPWKEDHDELPDNFGIAFQRLKSTVNFLNKRDGLFEAYNQI
ncbi:hypothetical protein L596_000964 [Steinernema carpocapsae]|uniref:DUF1758 domain-containing protein n=1 Tax=Steinernema carpocapsae TaxID=34508 RepID=A0A4U8UM53_STECR|nr:hypothetical protein L596_000964 [Steinernema carpocapsae]